VVALVVVAFFGYVEPYRHARADYDAALADLVAAQGDLVTQISQAQATATAVASTPVADQAALDGLKEQIAEATTLTTKPGPRPVGVNGLRAETDRLTAQVPLVKDATQQLADLADSLMHSQIDALTSQLSDALTSAQTALDQSAGLVADESVRTDLASAIAQASDLLATPPADLTEQVTQLLAALAALTSGSQAVTDEVQATAVGTYDYLLTGDAISQGTNLVGGAIASVKVEVQQAAVVVAVCWSNVTVTDPANCLAGDSTTPAWWIWSGIRSGGTATVTAQSNNPDGFFWGTITFESAAAQAPATGFIGASGCTRSAGAAGHVGAGGHCQ